MREVWDNHEDVDNDVFEASPYDPFTGETVREEFVLGPVWTEVTRLQRRGLRVSEDSHVYQVRVRCEDNDLSRPQICAYFFSIQEERECLHQMRSNIEIFRR